MTEPGLQLEDHELQTMTRAFSVALESLTDVAREHPQSDARALYDRIGDLSTKIMAYAKTIGVDPRGGRRRRW